MARCPCSAWPALTASRRGRPASLSYRPSGFPPSCPGWSAPPLSRVSCGEQGRLMHRALHLLLALAAVVALIVGCAVLVKHVAHLEQLLPTHSHQATPHQQHSG